MKRKRKAKTKRATNKKPQRPYPIYTVAKALQVAAKIRELNGGNPWEPEQLANALTMGPKSPNFYYLTAASRDYGLTKGTARAEKIEIEQLGTDILFAPNPDTERAKKLEAFLRVPLFKQVLDHYKGSNLPDLKYLGNTLQKEFSLHPGFHKEFARIFRDNCQELGIEAGVPSVADEDAKKPAGRPTKVLLGEPSGSQKGKLKAFVVMPFDEKKPDRPKGFFAEVLSSLITPAGLNAGFTVETANRQGSDVIQSTIINDLLEADLVIADLTDHNPNVLFELGVRMAMDKPVALIKAAGTGHIFDVDNMLRVHEYSANLWGSTIEKDLPELSEHIKAAWDNRDTDPSYMKILRRQTQT